MNICLFELDELGQPLPLSDARAAHVLKVLHKGEGDSFCAGVIGGDAGRALIVRIEREGDRSNKGKLYFDFDPTSSGKRLFPVTLIVGFPRPIQLRRILRELSSLGVEAIHLVGADLGEKSYLSSSLSDPHSCRAFLIEGATQAGSTLLPKLSFPASLDGCLATLSKEGADGEALLALDNVERDQSLATSLIPPPARVTAAVGCERGWTKRERQLLRDTGFCLVGLGDRVLRGETACTAATSLILASMGAFES